MGTERVKDPAQRKKKLFESLAKLNPGRQISIASLGITVNRKVPIEKRPAPTPPEVIIFKK